MQLALLRDFDSYLFRLSILFCLGWPYLLQYRSWRPLCLRSKYHCILRIFRGFFFGSCGRCIPSLSLLGIAGQSRFCRPLLSSLFCSLFGWRLAWCFGIWVDLAQGYPCLEHKGPLVGLSAAGLALVANQEDRVFTGLVDGKQVALS